MGVNRFSTVSSRLAVTWVRSPQELLVAYALSILRKKSGPPSAHRLAGRFAAERGEIDRRGRRGGRADGLTLGYGEIAGGRGFSGL